MPDPTILKMTVADALERADDWTAGLTLHPLSEGMRVAILVLATEVRRLQSNQRAMAALADERAGETFAAKVEAAKLRAVLRELHAAVVGECPSLLDEDRGGSARLAMAIEGALAEGEAGNAG